MTTRDYEIKEAGERDGISLRRYRSAAVYFAHIVHRPVPNRQATRSAYYSGRAAFMLVLRPRN